MAERGQDSPNPRSRRGSMQSVPPTPTRPLKLESYLGTRHAPNRWQGLAAGSYLGALAGLVYTFPIYSGNLKRILSASQESLSWVATFGVFGGDVAILPGASYDKWGPRVTAQIGCILSSIGFLGIYLASTGDLKCGVPGVALFYCIACQGLTFMDVAAMATQLDNFRLQQGQASGVVKTQTGISSSAVIVIIVGFFGIEDKTKGEAQCLGDQYIFPLNSPSVPTVATTNDQSNLAPVSGAGIPMLLLFSILCLVVGTMASQYLHLVPESSQPGIWSTLDRRRMSSAYICTALNLCYLTFISLLNMRWEKRGGPPAGSQFAFALIQLVLYLNPFMLTSSHWQTDMDKESSITYPKHVDGEVANATEEENATLLLRTPSKRNNFIEERIISAQTNGPEERSSTVTQSDNPQHNSHNIQNGTTGTTGTTLPTGTTLQSVDSLHNFSFCQALCSLEFWCICLWLFGSSGCGIMTIQQLTQINTALGGTSTDNNSLTVVFGISNCSGRYLSGFAQDKAVARGINRPLLCCSTLLAISVGQFLMSQASTSGFLLLSGVSLTGLAFGSSWVLLAPLVSDITGKKSFGKIYSVVTMSSMFSTSLFNQAIAAPFYDHQYVLQKT
eukprot:g9801.t1